MITIVYYICNQEKERINDQRKSNRLHCCPRRWYSILQWCWKPSWFRNDPKMVAYVVQTKGLAESVFHSSSMDFADEEGFDTYDGAWKLWETWNGVSVMAYFYEDWKHKKLTVEDSDGQMFFNFGEV